MSWIALGRLTRELRDGEVVVGSGADADWRVPTADLMPRHFVLTVHGLNVSIRPCSPEIVVVVNGTQLLGTYHLLNDGDTIAAGQGRLTFSDDEPHLGDSVESDVSNDGYLIDDQRHEAHRLVNRSTTLGRDASNAIVLRDPRASRFHAEIRREAGGFALHTMGSAGTTLNGEPMRGPRMLRDGDRIEIAYAGYRFAQSPPSEAVVATPDLGMNDQAAVSPTAVGPRATMESSIQATRPPGPVLSWTAVAVFATLVVVAILVWYLAAR